MGGYGSGKRWGAKNTTGDYLALDVRRLQRDGLLEHRYSFNWRWSRNGETAGNIDIRPDTDRVTLSYRHRTRGEEWESKEYPVLLEWTPCRFGGERVWFRCPARGCGRRVAILYGGEVYACRRCHGLAYACQQESPHDRAARRAEKLGERLKTDGSIFDAAYRKPKGMHRRTYEGLVRRYDAARYRSVWEFAGAGGHFHG